MVRDDHHLVGDAQHLPLGLDQQQVAVEQPLGRDAADAQDRLMDVDVVQHPHRQRAEGDARFRIDVAAEDHEVRLVAVGEQRRDGQAVGHDLHRPADQQPGHFQRRRAAVEQHRVAVAHPGDGRLGHRSLFVRLRRRPLFQGRQGRAVADVDGAAVRPPQRPLLVPVVEIAAQRRFRRLDRLGQIGQGDEAAFADQIQHPLPTFFDQHGVHLPELERNLSLHD